MDEIKESIAMRLWGTQNEPVHLEVSPRRKRHWQPWRPFPLLRLKMRRKWTLKPGVERVQKQG